MVNGAGQKSLRNTLNQAESVLLQPAVVPYNWTGITPVYFAPALAPAAVAAVAPAPAIALPVPGRVPAPVAKIAPVPAPAVSPAEFTGVTASTTLPEALTAAEFTDISASAQLLQPVTTEEFTGISSEFAISPVPVVSFEKVKVAAVLQLPIGPKDFKDAISAVELVKTQTVDAFVNAVSAARLAVPAPADFTDITASTMLPEALTAAEFTDISASTQLLQPVTTEEFTGISSEFAISLVPVVSFEKVKVTAVLPLPIGPKDFKDAISVVKLLKTQTVDAFVDAVSAARLAQPKPADFTGIATSTQLPQPLTIEGFVGASSESAISPAPVAAPVVSFEKVEAAAKVSQPVSSIIFEEVTAEAKIKVMLPGGQRIIPTYELGIPLGAERPVMEPAIKEKEDKR